MHLLFLLEKMYWSYFLRQKIIELRKIRKNKRKKPKMKGKENRLVCHGPSENSSHWGCNVI